MIRDSKSIFLEHQPKGREAVFTHSRQRISCNPFSFDGSTAFNGTIGICNQVLMLIKSYAPAADHVIHTNTERTGKKKSGKRGNSASPRTSLVLYIIYPTPLSQHSFHRRIFTNGRDERSRPSPHAFPREQRSSRSRVLPQILSIVSKTRDLENGLYLRSTFVDLNLHAGTLFSNRMSNSPYDRPLVKRQ
jgi:hypothetical protein